MEKKLGALGGLLVIIAGLAVATYGIMFDGYCVGAIGIVIFLLGVWFTGNMVK